MPNQPKTQVRSVRISDDEWLPVVQLATSEGITATDVVRHSLAISMRATALGRYHRCQHSNYRMTCADYDELEARAIGCCQLCGVRSERLWLDHDHDIGDHAVRGLVCPKCNAHMRRIDDGTRVIDAPTAAYIENAWHAKSANRSTQRDDSPDAVWLAAQAKADERNENLSEIIRRALERYVKTK